MILRGRRFTGTNVPRRVPLLACPAVPRHQKLNTAGQASSGTRATPHDHRRSPSHHFNRSQGRWEKIAQAVLDGRPLSREEGLALLRSGDDELLELLAAAYRVRYRWFGNQVHLNFLINAKCGGCSEDCGYCSQSKVSTAEIAPLQPAGRGGTARRGAAGRRSGRPRPIAS